MTEVVDHMSYIFGSFSRRRQSQDVGFSKKRAENGLKIFHERSNSAPQNPTNRKKELKAIRACSVYDSVLDENKYKCPSCKKFFLEPRVLPCLHTFCTTCLQQMEAQDLNVWGSGSDVSSNSRTDGSDSTRHDGSGSAGSGYESDKRDSSDPVCIPPAGKGISCPICGMRSALPSGGVLGLPPHYLLQHRMVLAVLNSATTKLLCDPCTSETTATYRCSQCAISLCTQCADSHYRQKKSHEILTVDEARKKGIRIRRQIMCSVHTEKELTTFCANCFQVICQDCMSHHKGHVFESIPKAMKFHAMNIKEAVKQARMTAEQTEALTQRLQADSKRIQARCTQVQQEIEQFIETYIKEINEHKMFLINQVNQAKEEKLRAIEQHQIMLQKKLKEAKDVVTFTDDFLNEATDVELLSFIKPISKKIEQCEKLGKVNNLKISDSVQFLPEEVAPKKEGNCVLYGVVTTQSVCPKNCILNVEGLQQLRVGQRAETTLETRDSSDTPLQRGGEKIYADLRHRDSGATKSSISVKIEDNRDGTYLIHFVPDIAGKFFLVVQVKGQPIKDNPLPIIVRALRPHHGTYHCCSFCSSGGSKEVGCGCGGKMPGGYRGCGHGHEGHPGRRHWSCCGNVQEHSECNRLTSTHYQFTL